ncbi:MAG: 23S rRNA (guanosine(2251)-2'-O)-methyltransferase RlmB [Polyangiales bacterium]
MKRILTGPRFVAEALKGRDAKSIHAIYVEDPQRADVRPVVEAAERARLRVETRSRAALDQLSGGVKHQGVVAVAGEYRYVDLEKILDEARQPPLLVALDEVTDPHNFGAIVRSAVGLGADGLVVPKHRSAPVSAVVVRASAGATEHARIAEVTNLQRTLHDLGDRGLQIVGLDGDGTTSIAELPPAPGGRVLVVGSEGAGLRRMVRERCTVIARIPQDGPVESFNASVAAAIALYECARQRA